LRLRAFARNKIARKVAVSQRVKLPFNDPLPNSTVQPFVLNTELCRVWLLILCAPSVAIPTKWNSAAYSV